MTNKVDMADLCELAHELTVLECRRLGIDEIDEVDAESGDIRYTEKVQDVFNNYYDLICTTLNV